MPLALAAYGVLVCVNAAFDALGRMLIATGLMLARTFGLFVPLVFLGGWLYGLPAAFLAATVVNRALGIVAYVTVRRRLTH